MGERTKIIEKHNISLKWLFDKPSNILYELHAAWQMIDGCFGFFFFFWKVGQSTTLFWTKEIKFRENTWDCEWVKAEDPWEVDYHLTPKEQGSAKHGVF